jgi:hypothetical protein
VNTSLKILIEVEEIMGGGYIMTNYLGKKGRKREKKKKRRRIWMRWIHSKILKRQERSFQGYKK